MNETLAVELLASQKFLRLEISAKSLEPVLRTENHTNKNTIIFRLINSIG